MCIRQHSAPALRDQRGHPGVGAKGGDVVDEARAGVERRRATATFEVSIETVAPMPAPTSPSITGITRRSSSSAATAPAPGRVDSPPTSTIAAARGSERRPCSIAAAGSR